MNSIEPQLRGMRCPPARLRRRAGAVPTAGAISLIGISSPAPRIASRAVRGGTRRESGVRGGEACFDCIAPRNSRMYKRDSGRWPLRPALKIGAAIEQDPPARPRRRGGQAGEGARAWAPLTALGEGSVERSIREAAALRPARKMRPAACAAFGPDGAAGIRRCFPTPSPPHSPPPSPPPTRQKRWGSPSPEIISCAHHAAVFTSRKARRECLLCEQLR